MNGTFDFVAQVKIVPQFSTVHKRMQARSPTPQLALFNTNPGKTQPLKDLWLQGAVAHLIVVGLAGVQDGMPSDIKALACERLGKAMRDGLILTVTG